MDLRIHGIDPAILRQAKARATAAGDSLSAVLRRLVTRYAEQGEPGVAGGQARAAALSADRRAEIASAAAKARWADRDHR